jgi:hypothetical protein
MLGRESLYIVKSTCIGGCAWEKCYDENSMAKCQLQCL